jgi:hypothetical protein
MKVRQNAPVRNTKSLISSEKILVLRDDSAALAHENSSATLANFSQAFRKVRGVLGYPPDVSIGSRNPDQFFDVAT